MLVKLIKNLLLKVPPYYRSYIPFILEGKEYRRYLEFIKKFDNYSEEDKMKYQQDKVEEIFKNAERNKYYNSIGINKNLKFIDLKKLSFLTREIIKNNDLVTIRSKQKLMKSFTSGSSGSPLTVYRNRLENQYETATIHYLLEKCGVEIKKRVRVLNIRTNSVEKPYRYGDCLYIPIRYINNENIEKIYKLIKEFSPNVIHAHPSVMVTLSSFLKLNKMEPRELSSLKVILLSSEFLSEGNKDFIYSIFKTNILDYYSNEENSICGYRIYPQMDFFEFPKFYSYIEVIENELICTSLTAKTMPFIRYKTGDYISGGNLNHVKHIAGRTSEYLIDKNGVHIPLENFSTYEYPSVELFQFCQLEKGVVEFRMKSFPREKIDYKRIEKILYNINNDIKFRIKEVTDFSKTKNNKHKILIHMINEERE